MTQQLNHVPISHVQSLPSCGIFSSCLCEKTACILHSMCRYTQCMNSIKKRQYNKYSFLSATLSPLLFGQCKQVLSHITGQCTSSTFIGQINKHHSAVVVCKKQMVNNKKNVCGKFVFSTFWVCSCVWWVLFLCKPEKKDIKTTNIQTNLQIFSLQSN